MEFRELRSFVVLAEQLHFGRAAHLLHLSQPALTKQIRRLEDTLGCLLFERGKAGTRLSTFGQRFLLDARSALYSVDQLLERTRKEAIGETGVLRIGTGIPALKSLPTAIAQMREVAPMIEIQINEMSSEEQIAALYSGRIDAGFSRLPFPRVFRSLRLMSDRLGLVTNTNSFVRQNIDLAEFKDQPFVSIAEQHSPGFFHHMLRICTRHGFHPRIIQQVPDYTTALALVGEGLGVTMIPASFWSERFAGTHLHLLNDREARWAMGVAWRKHDSNPVLKRFLKLLHPSPQSCASD